MSGMNNIPVDVLAFGAHPDDLELAMGGTLIKLKSLGYRVGMVDLTRGERGTRGTAQTREAEAKAALEITGADFRENLDLGDQELADTPERRCAVVECIRRHRPSLVFTHYFYDRHPDHEGAARLVKHAMFLSGAANAEAEGKPHTQKRLLYFFSHWVAEPNLFVDVSDFYAQKIRAAKSYTTQFYDPSSREPATQLSRPEFWDDLDARFRWFGAQIGVKYAEAFWMREKMRVDDPVALFGR
jgi:bacillithiol biosynthesis deacetylase BshB1